MCIAENRTAGNENIRTNATDEAARAFSARSHGDTWEQAALQKSSAKSETGYVDG